MWKDFIFSLIAVVAFCALVWLYCAATPDQRSAEADWIAEATR